MQNIIMKINLTLKGPLLTQSSSPGELGLDLVVARHSNKDKTPYLSGTLITGKLRQALEEIEDIAKTNAQSDLFKPKLDHWLGKISNDFNPKTKQLYFSDFDLRDSSKLNNHIIRDRITINEETGAVKPRHIVMVENPFISGEEYTFSGKLHFFAPEKEINNILKHIKTGFNWFTQLGSMKSVGFGQIVDVSFDKVTHNTINPPSTSPVPANAKIGLIIKPDYPFCFPGKPVTDNNLFESEVIIPGGAIIGSIATTWAYLLGKQNNKVEKGHDTEREALNDNFSKLRITHAFPSSEHHKRPIVAPLSLTKIGDNQLYDVALLSKPCLIRKVDNNEEPPETYEVPDFALDWKDDEHTLKEYPWPYIRMKDWGWASLNSDLRVRTAIDREDYRSKKSELFAYEQIIPNNQEWYAELDLSRIKEDKRAEVLEQLKTLLEYGIIGLSKTKTPASIEFDTTHKISSLFKSDDKPKANKQWIITLQTDTLLGSPQSLDETSGETELHKMYADVWEKELSTNKSLKLIRYFARQKMSGGEHRRVIFQKREKPYRPWLLTEAGSVFVLQATEDEVTAQADIKKWQDEGLPLANSTCKFYEINSDEAQQWRNCPFIAQNGYGEIAVNIDASNQTNELSDNDKNSELITLINRVED